MTEYDLIEICILLSTRKRPWWHSGERLLCGNLAKSRTLYL